MRKAALKNSIITLMTVVTHNEEIVCITTQVETCVSIKEIFFVNLSNIQTGLCGHNRLYLKFGPWAIL